MTDYRMTPSNGRVAHISLRGKVAADRYVVGEPARVTTELADLLVRPDGARDRQVLHGDRVLVLERLARHAFVQVEKDGFCGYLPLDGLGRDGPVTHWVSAPATHLYATPTIKRREIGCLTMGSRLQVVAEEAAFLVTTDGVFVPRQHLSPVGSFLTDPLAVAETFLGTPYLWGGNSRWGIDCSGLVQAALLACGIACPGDSDLQWEALGTPIGSDQPLRRGDLMFWEGHVAVVADQSRILHANGHRMAVTYEGRQDALDRIAASGKEGFLGTRRL